MDALPEDKVLADLHNLRIEHNYINRAHEKGSINGGDGQVWFADLTNTQTPVRVAVKELRPAGEFKDRSALVMRLARQLKLWSQFKHPNLIALIGFSLDEDRSQALLISPYMENGDISHYLKKAQPSPTIRLKLALDTAKALKYLHELDPALCHGDLKSHNVLVTNDIDAVLCDFGLLKMAEGTSGFTTSYKTRGTLRYMSWELASDDNSKHTLPSDMWAWGCLFIEITFDLVPYKEAQNDRNVMTSIAKRKKPADLQKLNLSQRLRSLVESCWNEDRSERPTAATCCNSLHTEYDSITGCPPHISSSQDDSLPTNETRTGTIQVVPPPTTSDQREALLQSVAGPRIQNASVDQSQSQEHPLAGDRLPNLPSRLHGDLSNEKLAQAIDIVNRVCGIRLNAPLGLSDAEKAAIVRCQPQWQALAVQVAQTLDDFRPVDSDDIQARDAIAIMCAKLLDQVTLLNSEQQPKRFIVTHFDVQEDFSPKLQGFLDRANSSQRPIEDLELETQRLAIGNAQQSSTPADASTRNGAL